MTPKISVVIPAHNEEDGIQACLKSLVNQNYSSDQFEIILVDNNCEDKTVEIAKNYPVRIVKEKRQGLTFARIRGISNSSAPIIAFIDADSQASSDWLENIDKMFKEQKQVVAIGFSGNHQPKNMIVNVVEFCLKAKNKVDPTLPGYCFCFRKDAYLKVGGFDARIQFGEDIYISKKLKKYGKIIVVDEMVATSSRRYQSFSSFISYAYKTIISLILISLFNKSPVKLTSVTKNKQPV